MNPKSFATQVVQQLQQADFSALWAGGCVRDQLLGIRPKDYDVATNATPAQVQELFGKRRTIAIGASFGVITVIGTKESGNIEVATFRRDMGYSDGRRPDAVEFTDAQEDAIRRDFTINGMFYDPVQEQLIDYVEGRADIECRLIRAIGKPEERIDEDKLRMLRAIRFAATYQFEIEPSTMVAIQSHAADISTVSPERIGAEMRRMLAHPNRSVAVELLKEAGLLKEILQDGEVLYNNRSNWRTRLRWLEELGDEGTFYQAAAILLSRLLKIQGINPTVDRWKLSNAESSAIQWIENNLLQLSRAHHLPWSTIQPLLIQTTAAAAIQVGRVQFGANHDGIKFCASRLQWPEEKLNPPALIDGSDLSKMGIPPGPVYSKILNAVRVAQLDEEISNKQQASELADSIVQDFGE
ncbi:MAG: CCA tRNA nucleotidyltransferase [Planctomycetota bacterium]